MKNAVVLLASLNLIAGCGGQLAGSGQLSNGEPLSVVLDARMINPVESYAMLDIESPAGWSCKADINESDTSRAGSVRHSIPVRCSDGATGTMLMTMGGPSGKMQGAFKLSNGRSGQISVPFKPTR